MNAAYQSFNSSEPNAFEIPNQNKSFLSTIFQNKMCCEERTTAKICRKDSNINSCIDIPIGGVQCYTVDHSKKLLAVADRGKKTCIYIIELENYEIVAKIQNEDFHEYIAVEFGIESCLLTLEKPPKFLLTLWNWKKEYGEDKDKMFSGLRKDVLLLPTQEERINYTRILMYIIYHKRTAFNKRFKDLLESKKRTVDIIKNINSQVKIILDSIDEERELWEPEEVVESLESTLQATEEEINQNCPLQLARKSKIVKGIAAYFLEDPWLLKILSPTVKEERKKHKREAVARMKKKLRNCSRIPKKHYLITKHRTKNW
ncbi:cilia- and flagella-associated protein 43 [Caerostris extrusa]|uniref:Cilia- and flagella-associated protein 43 n=1 Tax=Caerostris extrusa TaxID=172846 RepID=A0AAV4QY22_CAEEX|nr:cilia- and flagella-associated protein 43 [Caerostris extrusa]